MLAACGVRLLHARHSLGQRACAYLYEASVAGVSEALFDLGNVGRRDSNVPSRGNVSSGSSSSGGGGDDSDEALCAAMEVVFAAVSADQRRVLRHFFARAVSVSTSVSVSVSASVSSRADPPASLALRRRMCALPIFDVFAADADGSVSVSAVAAASCAAAFQRSLPPVEVEVASASAAALLTRDFIRLVAPDEVLARWLALPTMVATTFYAGARVCLCPLALTLCDLLWCFDLCLLVLRVCVPAAASSRC